MFSNNVLMFKLIHGVAFTLCVAAVVQATMNADCPSECNSNACTGGGGTCTFCCILTNLTNSSDPFLGCHNMGRDDCAPQSDDQIAYNW